MRHTLPLLILVCDTSAMLHKQSDATNVRRCPHAVPDHHGPCTHERHRPEPHLRPQTKRPISTDFQPTPATSMAGTMYGRLTFPGCWRRYKLHRRERSTSAHMPSFTNSTCSGKCSQVGIKAKNGAKHRRSSRGSSASRGSPMPMMLCHATSLPDLTKKYPRCSGV